MEFFGEKEHWFSFRDSCISVIESASSAPLNGYSPTIIFLHGRFGQGEIWAPLIEDLSTHFRCITVDFPGFGRSFSARDRAFSLLEHTSLVHEIVLRFTFSDTKVVLVGHDVGGGIAQLCALRCSERVAALILINSAGLTQALEKIRTGFHGCLAYWKLVQLLKLANTMSPQFKAILTVPWKNAISRNTLVKSFRAFEDSWPWHYERQAWKLEIQNMDRPVLLLWGKKDPVNPPEVGAEILQKLKAVDFYMHEDSGHWPNLEQPEWVLTKIKEFIFKTGFDVNPTSVQKSLLQ